jgi:hypothetical protein
LFDCAPAVARARRRGVRRARAVRRRRRRHRGGCAVRVLRRGGGRLPDRDRRRDRVAWTGAVVLPRRAASRFNADLVPRGAFTPPYPMA